MFPPLHLPCWAGLLMYFPALAPTCSILSDSETVGQGSVLCIIFTPVIEKNVLKCLFKTNYLANTYREVILLVDSRVYL